MTEGTTLLHLTRDLNAGVIPNSRSVSCWSNTIIGREIEHLASAKAIGIMFIVLGLIVVVATSILLATVLKGRFHQVSHSIFGVYGASGGLIALGLLICLIAQKKLSKFNTPLSTSQIKELLQQESSNTHPVVQSNLAAIKQRYSN